jgi:hypothetical protein
VQIYFLESTTRFDEKLEYSSAVQMDMSLCPLNAGMPSQHAMRQKWRRPLKIIGAVQRMTDFEWTVHRDVLVEKDIVEQLAVFSGAEFKPVELYTTTESPIGRQVFELKVIGWGGMAPPQSGIRIMKECPHCKRRVFSGLTNPNHLFSPEAWDGSDFFIIWPMPKYVFVTQKVANFINKSEYSGVRVKPLDKMPKSVSGKYSPGHLHDWFEGKKLTEVENYCR